MESVSSLLRHYKLDTNLEAKHTYFTTHPNLPQSMKRARTLTGHLGCINTVSFNPIGDLILTGCDDGTVYLWGIEPKPLLMLRPHHTNVFTTNFLTNNSFISGGNDSNVVYTKITNSGATATKYYDHHHKKVLSSFVCNETTFVTCSYDKTIRLFDVRLEYPNTMQISSLRQVTESELSMDGELRLMQDLRAFGIRSQDIGGGYKNMSGRKITNSSLLVDGSSEVESGFYTISRNPTDSNQFLASLSDGTIRLFDMRTIKSPSIKENNSIGFSTFNYYRANNSVTGAAFSEDGTKIAASVIGGFIHVFDVKSAQEIKQIDQSQTPHEEDDEEEDRTSKVPGCLHTLKGHRSFDTIKGVNWFGDFVVSGSDDGNIFFYDVENEKIASILEGHDNHVNVVATFKNEKLATSGIDNYAIVWEPDNFTNVNEDEMEAKIDEIVQSNIDYSITGAIAECFTM